VLALLNSALLYSAGHDVSFSYHTIACKPLPTWVSAFCHFSPDMAEVKSIDKNLSQASERLFKRQINFLRNLGNSASSLLPYRVGAGPPKAEPFAAGRQIYFTLRAFLGRESHHHGHHHHHPTGRTLPYSVRGRPLSPIDV
jgi:hypothetical protein